MASGGGDGHDQKMLKEMLKMTLNLSEQELQEYKHTEIDKERQEWLKGAIEHTLENDDGKKLALFTNMLFSYKPDGVFTESELSDLNDIFEQLQFLIEGMDMAKDFDKLGGLVHCLKFFKSNYTSVQWKAADLVANCAQNNPTCQASLIQHNAMELLFYTLKKSKEDIVRIKCVYALSAILGDYEPAEDLFVRLKGVDCLLKLIYDENLKLRLKSAFLLRKLLYGDILLEYVKIYENLFELIKGEHDETHEIIASILVYLISHDANVLKKCKEQSECLVKLLNKRVKYLQELDSDKFEDEIVSYRSILDSL